MPRTPLRSTSSNRTSRHELELFQQGIIVGQFLAGQKKADIQQDICKLLDKPVSAHTVACILKESGYGHWRV
ncbi:hypothetical protein BDV23DRAFT_157083 [Aspergillus alliaceus]|uniref:Uncharacterized protein n=1 Tax=Petromyces alliaceus TaxID=209559 RepID=A0A5N7C5S0_PETAA|nr:hypothetical protein BDV23DRAFT_157083 [Aspergillus alliaceus]